MAEIQGRTKVRYEFGTLEENNRAYPLYVKEHKTQVFLDKIAKKQREGKNFKYFIVYRVELVSFEYEAEYYTVEFRKKVLTPNSNLLKEVSKIVAEEENPEEYVEKYYNK